MVGWIAEQWFGYHGLATTSEGCSGHDCQEDSGMSDMQAGASSTRCDFCFSENRVAACCAVILAPWSA